MLERMMKQDDTGGSWSPEERLLLRSIRWRTAAGWVVVSILAWNYLLHPFASMALVATGNAPLPELTPLSLADVVAIIGLPVGGAAADRLKE